jgi:hypothetical protein
LPRNSAWFFTFYLLCLIILLVLAGENQKPKSVRFAELVLDEVDNAQKGGKSKSLSAKKWAANAFDEWCRCHGLSTAKSIADLSEEDDLHWFIDMLLKFILQMRKQDGSLYPPTS